MEIEQSYLSWILGLLNVCFIGVIKFLLGEQHDLRNSHKELELRVSKIEVLVAGEYMKREEATQYFTRLDTKLDLITQTLNAKADK